MDGQPESITPLVYEIVESTTPQTTVIDVVFGAVSIIGVIGAIAIGLGLSLAGVMLAVRKARGHDEISGGGGAIRLRLHE